MHRRHKIALRPGSLILFLLAVGLTRSIGADLPLARLWTISPPGGQVGSTVQVTLTGVDLDQATRIIFSHSNIVAALKTDSPAQDEPRRFEVAIDKRVPPGIYNARVVGRFGVSNPRAFAVSAWPEIVCEQTNTSPAQGISVPLGTVVNAHAEPKTISYFRFTADQGQRVLIDCATKEINSRMEPTMFVCDASGRELERSRRQSLLDFTAPAKGEYWLKIHDSVFRGGADYFYRLSIGAGPHIDFIFPPAGRPGTRTKHLLYGRGLPGAAPADEFGLDHKLLQRLELQIDLPAELLSVAGLTTELPLGSANAGLDGIDYRLVTTNGTSNPVLITAASAGMVVEAEPNNTPELAQDVPVPCEYEGQFYPAGDSDWVSFAARKGEVYAIEVISQRLGLPTNPFILVQRATHNDQGEEQVSDVQEIYAAETNLGGVEFNTLSRDPAWRLEVKEDGRYRLQVRDLFNSGQTDPSRVYRLIIRKPNPDFRLLALPQAPPQLDKDRREARVWTVLLRRGETVPIKVLAFRRDSFDGEIRLRVEGLPAGVTCSNTSIEPNQTSAVLLVTASETAAAASGAITIVGSARLSLSEITRTASAGSLVWDVTDYNTESVRSVLTSSFYLAVSGQEFAPLSLQAREQSTFEAHATDKIQIPVLLSSKAELTGNIKLKAVGFPALDGLKEIEISSKTNQASLELDLARLKVPVGNYQFYVFAQGQTKYRRLALDEIKAAEEAARIADQKAKDADKLAAELKAAADKASAALPDTFKTAEDKAAAEKTAADASARAQEVQKEKERLAQAAKAASQRLQFEDRSFTTYSGALILKITPPPGAATVAAKASGS